MYVVIAKPKQEELNYNESYANNRRSIFGYNVTHKPATPESGHTSYGINPLVDRSVFFCEDEKSAELLATTLTENKTGSTYVVLEERSIFQSIPPKEKAEVVKKSITKEGVLPK